MTPSFLAPRRSIAAWERRFRLSVLHPTTVQPSVSNACSRSRSLQAVFTWVRCQLFAYHVYPISTRRVAGTMSW